MSNRTLIYFCITIFSACVFYRITRCNDIGINASHLYKGYSGSIFLLTFSNFMLPNKLIDFKVLGSCENFEKNSFSPKFIFRTQLYFRFLSALLFTYVFLWSNDNCLIGIYVPSVYYILILILVVYIF